MGSTSPVMAGAWVRQASVACQALVFKFMSRLWFQVITLICMTHAEAEGVLFASIVPLKGTV